MNIAPDPLKSCCTPARQSDSSSLPSASLSIEKPVDIAANPHGSTRGMVRLDGGSFLMGSKGPEARLADGEGPVRQVEVRPFFLDACAVTNARFIEFVEATGYKSEAEQFGWSFVFHRHVSASNKKLARGASGSALWWLGIEGACWKRPEGPGSDIKKRLDHPVVHISWNDARAFCHWAGTRLPSEAEWEFAARGGLKGQLFPWGSDLLPQGKGGRPEHRCNIWQGKFPDLDTGLDGFTSTAPVKTYAPNAFGFYQMSGNVWEWCHDWFSANFHRSASRDNPTGPPSGTHRVVKGGSFLCHASYCNRYRCAARTANTPDSTTSHTGFRCAHDG